VDRDPLADRRQTRRGERRVRPLDRLPERPGADVVPVQRRPFAVTNTEVVRSGVAGVRLVRLQLVEEHRGDIDDADARGRL
jgi:hypothetical protein